MPEPLYECLTLVGKKLASICLYSLLSHLHAFIYPVELEVWQEYEQRHHPSKHPCYQEGQVLDLSQISIAHQIEQDHAQLGRRRYELQPRDLKIFILNTYSI